MGNITQQPLTEAQLQAMRQQQNFDPSVPKRAYTSDEWMKKEDWYVQQAQSISIPHDPSPAIIKQLVSDIDAILTVARIDYAYMARSYETYSLNMKVEEKRLFVELKLNPPAQYSTLKLSIDEMKGVVASTIMGKPWANTKYNLYDLVKIASNRHIFMEGVIKVLQDKKDLLITHSGMLKIENSIQGSANAADRRG